jgi:hypothetical protein
MTNRHQRNPQCPPVTLATYAFVKRPVAQGKSHVILRSDFDEAVHRCPAVGRSTRGVEVVADAGGS